MRITIQYQKQSKFGLMPNLRGLLSPIKIYLTEKESLPPLAFPYLHGDHEVAEIKCGQICEFVVPEKFKHLYGCQGSQKTKYLLISDLSDGDHIEMVDYYDRNSFGLRPAVWRIHDGLTILKVKLIITRIN